MNFFFVALFAVRLALPSSDGPATAALRQATAQLAAQVADAGSGPPSAALLGALRRVLDVPYLGQRALGAHWEEISPKQRAAFSRLFGDVIEAQYLSQLRDHLQHPILYGAEARRGDEATVCTQVDIGGASAPPTLLPVEYTLHLTGGRWRIFDLTTDGISVLGNYRSQFHRLIGKEGFDGLLRRMRQRRSATAHPPQKVRP
jgi:phospholipid transport system substrate-binding protein